MLTLGISTSSSHFAIVIGENKTVLYNSENYKLNDSEKNISLMVSNGLEYINRKINDVTNIIVDNGPGGTSSVRTGVAFANGLAYSLGINAYAVSSFELLGFDIYTDSQKPVILTTKSIKGNAFIGLFNNNRLVSISYGKIDIILPNIIKDDIEFIVTGFYNTYIQNQFKYKSFNLSDKSYGDIEFLINQESFFLRNAVKFPNIVIPITELSINHG